MTTIQGTSIGQQFLANRQHLAASRTNLEVLSGPARKGLCLLQGHREALAPRACLTVPSKPLDDAITERLLTAVTPLTIKLALEALTRLEERDQAIAAQWQRRIERARYDVDLAERRYEAVDANRLLASTLEQLRWNDAMQRMRDLEVELATFERQTLRSVAVEQKRQILQLGRDFPRLWAAPPRQGVTKKRMLRLLMNGITVVKGPEPKQLRLHIRWQGGAARSRQSRSACRRTGPKPFAAQRGQAEVCSHMMNADV